MLKLAPHRPSAEKGDKLSPFSGHHATAQYVASLHGVNEKTIRRAGEFAEVVDGTPTRPLAGSSCWRCSIHKGDKLSPLSESGSSCYGATVPPPLAPHRPPADNGVKLTPLSGSRATARQQGDLKLKLAHGRPPEDEKVENFSTFSGSAAATARHVGVMFGVGEKTVRNTAEVAEVVDCSAAERPDAQTRAPSTARLYGASQQCARPVHALTCRPLVGRGICYSHVHIPTTENKDNLSLFSGSHAPSRQLGDLRRAQPTVYRKGGKIFRLFWACCAASEKEDNLSTFTAGTEVRPTEVKLTSVRPHSRFALCPDNGVNLTPLSAGTEVRSTHCVSCATMATRKSGKIYHLFGLRSDRAAAERYNGSVCCADAYALSCPLRSLRLCCSRVLTPRSQSSITDVS
jgi:hypothetical protein